MIADIGRLAAEIDEDQSADHGRANLDQSEAATVEVLDGVHVRGRDEAPVEIVGPGVVGALDPPADGPLGLLDQPRAAMAADVQERPRDVVGAAEREDAARSDLAHQPATGLDDRRCVTEADPAAEQVLGLPGEDRRVREGGRGQHRCPLDGLQSRRDPVAIEREPAVGGDRRVHLPSLLPRSPDPP